MSSSRRSARDARNQRPQDGKAGQHIDVGDGFGELVQPVAAVFDGSTQFLEEDLLPLDGLVLGAKHAFLVVLEFFGDVAFGVLERLLAIELDGNALRVGVGDFDVVPEDLVVADLQ